MKDGFSDVLKYVPRKVISEFFRRKKMYKTSKERQK